MAVAESEISRLTSTNNGLENPYYSRFIEILPKLKKVIKGKDRVEDFGKKIGVCTGTMYSYLRGAAPNIAVTKMIIEEAEKLIF